MMAFGHLSLQESSIILSTFYCLVNIIQRESKPHPRVLAMCFIWNYSNEEQRKCLQVGDLLCDGMDSPEVRTLQNKNQCEEIETKLALSAHLRRDLGFEM